MAKAAAGVVGVGGVGGVGCRGDQAAGLRRLFGQPRTRIVSFVAGSEGVGKTTLLANLAVILAGAGRDVMIIDESAGNDMAALFGAHARHDLWQALSRERSLDDILLSPAPGVRVLPAGGTVRQLAELSAAQQAGLIEACAALSRQPDVVLIDGSIDHPLGFSPLGLAAHETVVVMAASGPAITEAYALVKKVSLAYARKDFRVVVNCARNADEAKVVFGNMARVTHGKRLAEVRYAGCVPHDTHVRQAARLCQPVAAVFPEAPASRAYHALATELLEWPTQGAGSGGIEQFMQQLLHLSQRIDPIAIYA